MANLQCAVCLESAAAEPVVTRCGHFFCWPCLQRWVEAERTKGVAGRVPCPVCKGGVDPGLPGDVTPIYGADDAKASAGSRPRPAETARGEAPREAPRPTAPRAAEPEPAPAMAGGVGLVGGFPVLFMLGGSSLEALLMVAVVAGAVLLAFRGRAGLPWAGRAPPGALLTALLLGAAVALPLLGAVWDSVWPAATPSPRPSGPSRGHPAPAVRASTRRR